MLKFIQMKKLLFVFGLLFSFTTAFAAVHSVENISEKVKGDRLSLSDVNSILGTIRGFFFDDSTGNVGIGTSSPYAKLQVGNGSTSIGVGPLIDLFDENGTIIRHARGYFGINTKFIGNDQFLLNTDGANNGGSILWSDIGGNTYISAIASNDDQTSQIISSKDMFDEVDFTILQSGNVGIGTTSPQSQLHVNGDIIADRVSGKNIFPFQYASWEVGSDGDAVEFFGPDDVTLNVSTDYSFDGKRSLKQTTQSIDGWAYYYPSTATKYNIPVKPNTTYIYSVYARVPDGGNDVLTQIYIRMNDASGTYKSNAGTASTDWTRTSLLFTTGSDVNAIAIRTDVDPASDTEATIYFDGFMLEEAVLGQTEPSEWMPSAASYGITVDSKENVGIGTTNPERKLLVKDDNVLPIQIEYDGILGNGSSVGIAFLDDGDGSSAVNSQIRAIREADYESGLAFFTKNSTTGTQESFRVYGNGNAWLKGELAENSDSRYKKDIQTLPSALQNILSLRGVSYYWKDRDDNTEQIGVIAQEVEKIYPQLVHTNEDGYKSVAYSKLVAPLIEAVKSLHQIDQNIKLQIEEIQKENAELRGRIEELEAR